MTNQSTIDKLIEMRLTAMVFTTNKEIVDWAEMMGDPVLTTGCKKLLPNNVKKTLPDDVKFCLTFTGIPTMLAQAF